jgi:hypothetical protein
MHRSRSHLTLLISALSLICSLGAATIVPSTPNTGRQRQTRRCRVGNPRTPHLIRELDPHALVGSAEVTRVFDVARKHKNRAGAYTAAVLKRSVAVTPDGTVDLFCVASAQTEPLSRFVTPGQGRAPPASFS